MCDIRWMERCIPCHIYFKPWYTWLWFFFFSLSKYGTKTLWSFQSQLLVYLLFLPTCYFVNIIIHQRWNLEESACMDRMSRFAFICGKRLLRTKDPCILLTASELSVLGRHFSKHRKQRRDLWHYFQTVIISFQLGGKSLQFNYLASFCCV